MNDGIQVQCSQGICRTEHGADCETSAKRHKSRWRIASGHDFFELVRLLMLAGFCLLFIVGCASTPEFEVATVIPKQFTVTVEAFSAKQDDTLTAVKENTEAIEKIVVKVQSLEGAILDTRKTLEASLVKSETDNGQEVIKSEDTSPDKNANDSQPSTGSVAESGDVPLFVSVAPFCAPCNKMKKAWKDGKLKGFKVTWCVLSVQSRDQLIKDGIPASDIVYDKWQPHFGNPGIRYKTDKTASGWGVFEPYGYNEDILLKLRHELLGEPMPALPPVQNFPQVAQTETPRSIDLLRNTHGVQINGTAANYSGNQVISSRSAVRSVSRGPVINWRARSVSRSTCPTCPR